MKKILVVLLCTCSSVFAGPRVLAPVVDNSTYPSGGGVGNAAASTSAIYEVLGRLEQLQLEVQQLRGVVEDQSQTITNLKTRQGNIYSDLDSRLQEVTKVNTMLLSGQGIVAPTSATLSNQVAQVAKPILAKPSKAIVNVVKVENVITDKTRYQEAYQMLRNGHNSRAISAFNSIIIDFPSGEYADNSQYWLGEAYKVNQNLGAAKSAFLKVVMNYAGSPKVPDALLKLGYIEFEQNNMAQARDYLTQITVAHADTTASHLATKKLMQISEMQR